MTLTFEQKKELEELKHNYQMQELAFIRETEKIKHKQNLEFLRIENAEERKAEERRWLNQHGRRE